MEIRSPSEAVSLGLSSPPRLNGFSLLIVEQPLTATEAARSRTSRLLRRIDVIGVQGLAVAARAGLGARAAGRPEEGRRQAAGPGRPSPRQARPWPNRNRSGRWRPWRAG